MSPITSFPSEAPTVSPIFVEFLEHLLPHMCVTIGTTSSRRLSNIKEALKEVVLEYMDSKAVENLKYEGDPKNHVAATSKLKAWATWEQKQSEKQEQQSHVVIAIDTVLVTNNEDKKPVMHEKPTRQVDNNDYRETSVRHVNMLEALFKAGEHTVMSAIVVIVGGKEATYVHETVVRTKPGIDAQTFYDGMSPTARTEGEGMAGGLPIHHEEVQSILEEFHGCPFNAIGLCPETMIAVMVDKLSDGDLTAAFKEALSLAQQILTQKNHNCWNS